VLRDGICEEQELEMARRGAPPISFVKTPLTGRLNITLKQLAKELEKYGGNKSAAACALGISKVGLWKKMKKMGME